MPAIKWYVMVRCCCGDSSDAHAEFIQMMMLFFDESDTWGDPRIPLYEAVVRVLLEHQIAGATVLRGVMGFGAARHLREAGLFGVSPDRPVTVLCVDQEHKLRGVMPAIEPMITEGMVFLLDGEILHHAGGPVAANAPEGGAKP